MPAVAIYQCRMRHGARWTLLLAAAVAWCTGFPLAAGPTVAVEPPALVLVVGAAGEPEFETNFVDQVAAWKQTAKPAGAMCAVIGEEPVDAQTDRERLETYLQSQSRESVQPLWLVLIGHGTYDGKTARFNLRGPDLSAAVLQEWLQPFHRPLVILDTTSASAPFLNALSGTNRVIVTATRSGAENNFARFGFYLAGAFGNPESDLDRDDQVSLLEAFLAASARVEEFYKTEGRLATEHALLDDNGDGKGTPADWFRGIRAIKSTKEGEGVDGTRAHQLHLVLSAAEQSLSPETRAARDALELKIAALRKQKAELEEAEYYDRLEALLLKLARLYRTAVPSGSKPQIP